MKKGFLDKYKTYDTTNGYGNTKKWRAAFNTRMNKEEAASILQGQSQSPYNLLGIEPGASPAEIKRAYRRKAQEWHPDKHAHAGNEKEAETHMKNIIAAYTQLMQDIS